MDKISNETAVLLNRKFNATINIKRKEALKICVSIKDFFEQELNIVLPRYKNGIFEYRVKYSDNETYAASSSLAPKNVHHHDFWQYDTYGSELFDTYGELARMYYNLIQCSIKAEALFKDHRQPDKNAYETVLLACAYSKHRLDPIWNFRKSRLIRKKYTDYLKETQLHKQYTPVHLTLTVPHKDGLWNGKRYYSSELSESFNLLRKTATWKKYIYAGEYGIEVKPSIQHGLHIHIHSLCFQYKTFTINEVRKELEAEWMRIMSNNSGYSGMHYEGLYFYKKTEGSRDFDKELKTSKNRETGLYEDRIVRKKYYLTDSSSDEDMIHGIMECIKYHFKHDIFSSNSNDYNGYDIKFMAEVCKETRSKRLYSRFGAFYKEPRLNFNALESDGHTEGQPSSMTFEDFAEAEGEPTTMTYDPDVFTEQEIRAIQDEGERMLALANSMDERMYEAHARSQMDEGMMCEKELRIINPFTAKEALRIEYDLVLSFQNGGRRMSRSNQYKRDYTQGEHYYRLNMKNPFTTLWKMIMKGDIKNALDPSEKGFNEKDLSYTPLTIQENY